jgi:hypothetical protein
MNDNNATDTPAKVLEALEGISDGLKQSGLPVGATQITAGGKTSTLAELQAEVDGYVVTYKAPVQLEEQLAVAVKDRDAQAPAILGRLSAVRGAIKSALGPKSPALSKYAIAPDKEPAPLTLEQKTERAAKAKATRAARHTMGPKQKKAIKGEVPPAQTPPTQTPSGH